MVQGGDREGTGRGQGGDRGDSEGAGGHAGVGMRKEGAEKG